MAQIAATELKVGDTFSQAGSTRSYTVTEIVEAHRSEYTAVVRVVSSKGTVATVAFPANTTVTTK